MATKTTNLKVFVASPTDIVEERNVLAEIVSELNKLIGNKARLQLELVKWETDTYPSFGTDPQNVINEQIGDDYDIFIGIIWKRFGTPTLRGLSGTSEEFYGAYSKAQKNPKSVRVMFYFNTSAVSINDIDIEQLGKVKDFQASIGKMGIYYWQYNKLDEFKRLVRFHLGKVMQEYGSTWGEEIGAVVDNTNTSIPQPESNLDTEEDESEEGFLDLVILSVEQFTKGTESFNRISALLQELNEKTRGRTEEITQLPKPINPIQAKQVTNQFAEDWEYFVERMKVEIPMLSKAFRLAIDSWAKSAELMSDFKNDEETKAQIENAIGVVDNFIHITSDAKIKTKEFRDVVAGMPRLTNKFNHAKRHTLEVLDSMLEEYNTEENLSVEAIKVFSTVLPKEKE